VAAPVKIGRYAVTMMPIAGRAHDFKQSADRHHGQCQHDRGRCATASPLASPPRRPSSASGGALVPFAPETNAGTIFKMRTPSRGPKAERHLRA
jgi:hypothetical protein